MRRGGFDPPVLAQGHFFTKDVIDRFDAVDLALFDAPQGCIEDLECPRHLEADETPADGIDARGWRCIHGRPSIARLAPIAS